MIYHEIEHGPAESGCRVRVVAVAAMYVRPQFRAPRCSTPEMRRAAGPPQVSSLSEFFGVGAGSPIAVPLGWMAPESGFLASWRNVSLGVNRQRQHAD